MGKWSREEAADQVAKNFKGFCDLWQAARASSATASTHK